MVYLQMTHGWDLLADVATPPWVKQLERGIGPSFQLWDLAGISTQPLRPAAGSRWWSIRQKRPGPGISAKWLDDITSRRRFSSEHSERSRKLYLELKIKTSNKHKTVLSLTVTCYCSVTSRRTHWIDAKIILHQRFFTGLHINNSTKLPHWMRLTQGD